MNLEYLVVSTDSKLVCRGFNDTVSLVSHKFRFQANEGEQRLEAARNPRFYVNGFAAFSEFRMRSTPVLFDGLHCTRLSIGDTCIVI